jgi:regulator of replication initiation timing
MYDLQKNKIKIFTGETFHLCSKHFSSLLVKKELFIFATDKKTFHLGY